MADDKSKQAALDAAAKTAATQDAEAQPVNLKMGKGTLIVSGPEAGRRRAGHVFGKEPVTVDASTLSQEQVDAIVSDPLLSVKQSKS